MQFGALRSDVICVAIVALRTQFMSAIQDLEFKKTDDVIVDGSTWAAIWHMSWPLLINMLTISVASFADVYVAGQLGSDSQAAIGIGGQVWFLMVLFAVALSAGTTALVSRYWGARDYDTAIEACRQSLIFALFFGIVSTVLGLICGPALFKLFGATAAVQKIGWEFLKFDLLSQTPFTILWVVNAIFRAKGNARVPMLLWCVMVVLIIALDVILCLGPVHLGVAGIGLAWTCASVIGLGLGLFILSRSDVGECLNFKLFKKHGISKEWMLKIFNIGFPACIQDLAWVGGNFLLFLIFAQTLDPTGCQAAWAISFRIEEMVAGMPIYALSMAAATIIGQNLGAQKPERATKAGWQIAAVGSVYNLLIGILLMIFALPISEHMSTAANVVDYSAKYFIICGLSEPFLALWMILFGAMQGAGYTKWPMWVSSFCMTMVRLPLAWYFTIGLHWGPSGTWFAMAVTTVAVGSLAAWRFKSGVWYKQPI
jgi:putative MATE family efflux protein